MSAEVVPVPPPLLALLCNLAAVAAESPRFSSGKVRLRGTAPVADGLALDLDVRSGLPGMDGAYRVEVAILRTSRESTLCDVRIVQGPLAAKAMDVVRKLFPDAVLNWLLRWVSSGKAAAVFKLQGGRITVNHQALIALVLKR